MHGAFFVSMFLRGAPVTLMKSMPHNIACPRLHLDVGAPALPPLLHIGVPFFQ